MKVKYDISQAGSMMIEALAMLGLISMVTPVVYKKSADRMVELQDINAASQMRTLSQALDSYIKDHYNEITDEHKSIDWGELANYLPQGIVDNGNVYGALGDKYSAFVKCRKFGGGECEEGDTGDDRSLVGYIVANVRDNDSISAQRASRIATMIGSNGGVVDEPINGGNSKIYGSQGAWEMDLDAGFNDPVDGAAPAVNSVVVASEAAINSATEWDDSEFLHRNYKADRRLNAMYTDLYMNDKDGNMHNIEGVGQLIIGEANSGSNFGERLGKEDALYVGNNGSSYLTGKLTAASEALKVLPESLTYQVKGTSGSTNNGIFQISDGALDYKVGSQNLNIGKDSGLVYNDQKGKEFVLNGGKLSYDNDLIKADTTDTSGRYVSFVEDKVHINKEKTNVNNQLISDSKDYIDDEGNWSTDDGYKVLGNTTYFDNSNTYIPGYTLSDGNRRNINDAQTVLTGLTMATAIDTGYMKARDSEISFLRAGRSSLSDNKVGWNFEAEERGVKIGDNRDANGRPNSEARIIVASTGFMRYGHDGRGDSGSVDKGSILLDVGPNGDKNYIELNKNEGLSTYMKHGNNTSVVEDGDYKVLVKKSTSNSEKNNIKIMGNNAGSMEFINGSANEENGSDTVDTNGHISDDYSGIFIAPDKTPDDNVAEADVDIHASGDMYVRAGVAETLTDEDIANTANDGKFKFANAGDIVYDKNIYIKGNNLLVDDSTKGDSKENAWVHIRKGAIEVNSDYSENDKSADEGTGYVKADRFVVDNSDNTRKPNARTAVESTETGSVQYDHYMVDPAYTSVMHDIKLTTRGGARLSDILPDFINKGIYVVDNSNSEDYVNKSKKGSSEFASAYLGNVPAPQCPPGYAKVITLTPSGWHMAQVGTLTKYTSGENDDKDRLYLNELTNFKDTSSTPGSPTYQPVQNYADVVTDIDASDLSDVASKVTDLAQSVDKLFQSSTWMKSAIRVASSDDRIGEGQFSYTTTDDTPWGWETYMGFIYPETKWKELFKASGLGGVEEAEGYDTTVYWNLFPVDKYSLEGYATVYCYFDRKGLIVGNNYWNNELVDTTYDQFSNHRDVTPGAIKDDENNSNEAYRKRLNNPKLKYTTEW